MIELKAAGGAIKALGLGKRVLLWAFKKRFEPLYEAAHQSWLNHDYSNTPWRDLGPSAQYRLFTPSIWHPNPGPGGLAGIQGAVLELRTRTSPCSIAGNFVARSRTTGAVRVPFSTEGRVGAETQRMVLPGFPVDDLYVVDSEVLADVESVELAATVHDGVTDATYTDRWVPTHHDFWNGHLVRRFDRVFNIGLFKIAHTELHIALRWALLAPGEEPGLPRMKSRRWDAPIRRMIVRMLASRRGLSIVFWYLYLRHTLTIDEDDFGVDVGEWPQRLRSGLGVDKLDPYSTSSCPPALMP